MSSFILDHMEEIVDDWEAFAMTLMPAAATMDSSALRDHAKQMLEAIAKDIQTAQSDRQQEAKSKGMAPNFGRDTAAAAHGALRQHVGFDLKQLVAEFRALRASVLKIWINTKKYGDAATANEIARFNEAIDQALAESVETYSTELARSRDTFLGILGHDLRSPLGAMSGALHVMAKSEEAPARAKALAAGRRSVVAMEAMIRDLLVYTRTRLGSGIPVTPAPANLDDLCRVAIVEVELAHPNAAFLYQSEGMLTGTFDAERMHQVMSNLLNNAVHHGTPGTTVTLAASGNEHGLTYKVSNAGPVLSAEELQAIFEPMVQLPAVGNEARPTANLGLGLFIAREIVQAHGGTIEATSSAGDGISFIVWLPHPGKPKAA